MRGIAVVAKVFLLLVVLSAARLSNTIADSKTNLESPALTPGLNDSTITRIAPVQQDNGVGDWVLCTTSPFTCHMESKALIATVSWLIGCRQCIWIVWDMTAVPQDAEVISVEIEHELDPDPDNQPGIRLQYRSLENAYLPPPDCWIAYDDLMASSLYTDVEMGTSAGTRRYVLGGDATLDVAGAVGRQGYFSVWISAPGPLGSASVPGWNAGGPELIVTWRSPVAIKRDSWSTLKALFSRP